MKDGYPLFLTDRGSESLVDPGLSGHASRDDRGVAGGGGPAGSRGGEVTSHVYCSKPNHSHMMNASLCMMMSCHISSQMRIKTLMTSMAAMATEEVGTTLVLLFACAFTVWLICVNHCNAKGCGLNSHLGHP